MNEQLKFLVELQEIDSAILDITEKIESLPEKLNHYRMPLKKAESSFEKAKAGNEALNKKKKDKDIQLDETLDKIAKLKDRSSGIKTNKEYEAHLKEIESVEMSRRRIEDEILSLMEEMEKFSLELRQEEMKLREVENEFKRQEQAIEEEKKKLHAEIEALKRKREEYAARIDEEYYNLYMNLLRRAGGLAVVRTKNEVCLGCNTNIPPQLYNDIRKNEDIYTCYYCKRFLYYREEEHAAASGEEPQKAPPVS